MNSFYYANNYLLESPFFYGYTDKTQPIILRGPMPRITLLVDSVDSCRNQKSKYSIDTTFPDGLGTNLFQDMVFGQSLVIAPQVMFSCGVTDPNGCVGIMNITQKSAPPANQYVWVWYEDIFKKDFKGTIEVDDPQGKFTYRRVEFRALD